MRLLRLLPLVTCFAALTSFAQVQMTQDGPKRALKTVLPAPGAQKATTALWDSWYTVTLDGGVPYSYYNERAEIADNKVKVQVRMWKNEEGFINEESEGAFAANDDRLTPLFFNLRRTYRSQETVIDGTIENGKIMTVRVRSGDQERTPIKKHLPDRAIFTLHFPLWLRNNLARLKPNGTPIGFMTLLEDGADNDFPIENGTARELPADDFAKSSGSRKIEVNYQDVKSVWWIQPSGEMLRIVMPQRKMQVDKSTREKAEKFLLSLPATPKKGTKSK